MEKPNIALIIVDALRPKNLSLYGYKNETDKNMKSIAKESIFFSQHISCSNSTAPSLTSLFTGKFPSHHGIVHQFPYTKDEEIEKLKKEKFWLTSHLKEIGYDTIAIDWIGLWFKRGFNYYEEKEEHQKRLVNLPFIKKILLHLPAWAYKLGKKIVKKRASPAFPPASETMRLAIEKISESEGPFFLFMHLWDTHFPFPTTNYTPKSDKHDINTIVEKIKDSKQKEYVKKRIADSGMDSIDDIIGKYEQSITDVDKEIGRLVEFLKKEKEWDNTIFIIMGDHGDSLIEHDNYFSHSGLYEESIHVPLIIHFPGIEGKEIKELVQNVDIVPTILDFIEKKRIRCDGKSLLPLIKSGKKIRSEAFSWDGLSKDIRSVRTVNRKLIFARDSECHLCKDSHHKEFEEYDLEKDKDENNNIYSGKSELMSFLKE